MKKPRRAFYKKVNKQENTYQLAWAIFSGADGWKQITKKEFIALLDKDHIARELMFDVVSKSFVPMGVEVNLP